MSSAPYELMQELESAGVLPAIPHDLPMLQALEQVKGPLPAAVEGAVIAALDRADALATRDAGQIQQTALILLERLEDDVVPRLIERLESRTGPVGGIAGQLARLKDPRAAPALWGVLDSVEGGDRNRVLGALAAIPEPAVVPLLCRELLTTEQGSRQERFLVGELRRAVPGADHPKGEWERSTRAAAWRDFARARVGASAAQP